MLEMLQWIIKEMHAASERAEAVLLQINYIQA